MRRAALPLFCLTLLACGGGSRDRAPGTSGPSSNNANNANNNNANNNSNNNNPPPGPTIAPDHPALCNMACAGPSDGPCASPDVAACTNRCAASTNGFSAGCAACLLAESGFAGDACTCYGEGCTLCPFAPGDTACSGAGPGETCSASEEVCDGFEAADILGGPCENTCLGGEPPPDVTATLRERCVDLCANKPSVCAAFTLDDCVTACQVQTEASGGVCGLCRVEQAGWSGDRCTCYGEGCVLCPFGPEPSACRSATPEDTCAREDEVCDGIRLAAPGDGCAAYCEG